VIQFDAAPAVPLSYARLNALASKEIEHASAAGYVARNADPHMPVKRAGIAYYDHPIEEDLRDWRARMYLVWFCYIYEQLLDIVKPLYAIEELVLEFQSLELIDTPDCRLASAFAGAGARDPVNHAERMRYRALLAPHYRKAVSLLEGWMRNEPATSH
jgi:hypothetical protein